MAIQRILVPIDYSENSRNALSYALHLSHQHGAFVTVLNVFQLKKRSPFQSIEKIKEMEKDAQTEAREQVVAFIDGTRTLLNIEPTTKLKIQPMARIGFPIEEIMYSTEQHAFDIIIMGAKGGTNVANAVLGSNTERIMEQVKNIPVLVIPNNYQYRGVDCMVNFMNVEAANLPAVSEVVKLADMFESELAFLHHNPGGSYVDVEFKTKLQARMKQVINYPKLSVYILEELDILQGLEQFNLKQNIDLLALSVTEKTIYKRNSSFAQALEIMTKLKVPLLTFHNLA